MINTDNPRRSGSPDPDETFKQSENSHVMHIGCRGEDTPTYALSVRIPNPSPFLLPPIPPMGAPFAFGIAAFADAEAVGEVKRFAAAAAAFDEVPFGQGCFDKTVQAGAGGDGGLGVGEVFGEAEAQPEVE